jgi:chemotaxis protein MotB
VSFDEKPPPEIVIIRRGPSSEDDAHHGGAWKIAYADFMTALMALFLVMWLINATDAKTIAQIATYFNPIALTDRTTTDRGVQDLQQGGTGKDSDKQPPKTERFDKHSDPKNDIGRAGESEEGLFSDPYSVLNKLAARASKVRLPTARNGIRQDIGGDAGGEAFRDPFDPDFRYNSNADDRKSSETRPKFESAKESGDADRTEGEVAQERESSSGDPASPPAENPAGAEAKDKAQADQDPAAAKRQPAKASDKDVPESIKTEAAQIETKLHKAIEEAGLAELPDLSVKKSDEGVLIEVTDRLNFEMFDSSSARPKPELVVLMEKLAKVLTDQPGRIIIRGYTDARPFRSDTYDNWRLSTARAHIAHYMLLRGGLDKQRVEKIEGYADRDPKVPNDPNAAQNRRIAILLKPAKT